MYSLRMQSLFQLKMVMQVRKAKMQMVHVYQVYFVNSVGQLDDTKVAVDLNRAVVYGGLQWLPNGWLQVGGEAYAAPADEITGRIFLKAYLN